MFSSRGEVLAERSASTDRLFAAGTYWMVGALAMAMWGGPPGTWRATQWLFTYQNGVPRRALPGSLLNLTGDLTYWRITAVSVGLYAVAVGLLGWALSGLVTGDRKRFLTILVLLVSPIGFPFLAANIGRFDTILILLTVVAVWLVSQGRYRWLYVVVAIMGLVHEAALLLVVAWLASLLAYRRAWGPARSVLAVAGVVAGGMLLWTPPVPLNAMASRLLVDFPLVQGSLGVLYTDISANIHKGLSFLLSAAGAGWLMKVVVASSAVLVAGWHLRDRLLLAGSLAPLALLLVATDHERWVAFAAGLLIVSVVMHGRRFHSERLLIGLVVVSCALTVFLGGGLVFTLSEVFKA